MATPAQVIAGRYELTAPISRGGMGEVWRGYDTVLDRDIAVKLIRPGIVDTSEHRDELIARFRREARVTAKVEHPGVPAVYDAAFDAGIDRLFLVMQLVHGVSLADVLAERAPLSVPWTASIAAQICAVLSYAHAVPIVHRDLKPGNIMIAGDGGVKVLDFGVAAVLRQGVTKLTSTGSVIGTKPYMSPEQIQNSPVTPRSDLYGLGCLLHELLSGERVFDAEEEIALMYKHLEVAPTPLRQLVPEVPPEIERLVLDLLAKRPADRPDSAAAVYTRLAQFLPPTELGRVDQSQTPDALPDPTRPFRKPMAPRTHAPAPRRTSSDASTEPPSIGRADIARILDEVTELASKERFSQAVDLLAESIPSAIARFGRDDGDVIDLRASFASVLLLGWDYRRAAPEFEALAMSGERIFGARAQETLDYRRQAAVCRIELGETIDALPELESVLHGYQALDDIERTPLLELRLTISRLRYEIGQREQAAAEVREIYRDAHRMPDPDDELLAVVEELATRLGVGATGRSDRDG